ncbi:MAG: homoserine kinase [Chloroflexota bacterium]
MHHHHGHHGIPVGRCVSIDVPATTANLGAGFDVLAMALEVSNVITVEAVEHTDGPAVDLVVEGEGAGRLRGNKRNRFVSSLERGLRDINVHPRGLGWNVRMRNDIPLSRGMGSSASVTVAGLLAADAMVGGGALSPERILELAVEAEGHPDNAAAALLGGFVVVATMDGRPRAVRFDPPDALRCVLFVPERPLATREMRAALPGSVPFRDAVHNVGASSLVVAAMASGRLELLRAGTVDRLHEPYRATPYPELPRLTAAARAAGALGAALSGAGSTVIAFTDSDDLADRVAAGLREEAEDLALEGRIQIVRPRADGARVHVLG